MGIRKQFASDAVVYGLGKGIKKFIGFFLLPFYTRVLAPEDFGILETLSTGVLLLGSVLNVGLDSASGYYFFKYQKENKEGELLFTVFSLRLITVIPMIILGFFSDQISNTLFDTEEYAPVIWLSCMIIPVNLLMREQEHIYRFLRMPWRYNLLTVLKSLLGVGLGVLLVVIWRKGVWGVQIASLLSSLLTVLVSIVIYSNRYYRYRFNPKMARELFRFGAPLILAGVIEWVYISSDRFFLLHYSSLKELGYYGIASTLSQPLQIINMAVQMSFSVLFYSVYHNEEEEAKTKSKGALKDIWRLYLTVAGLAAMFMSIFSVDILRLVAGERYVPGAVAIPFLVFSYLAAQSQQITSVGLYLSKKTWYYTILIGITSALNVGLNFYFVPRYGFIGAAFTTLLAYYSYLLLTFIVSQRFFKVGYRLKAIVSFIFAAMLISVPVSLLERQDLWSFSYWEKALLLGLGCLLPWVFGMVKTEEIKQSLSKIRSLGK